MRDRRRLFWLILSMLPVVAAAIWLASPRRPASPRSAAPAYVPLAGSQSCRECHPNFHELWSTSHHGLAMQPFTQELGEKEFTTTPTPVITEQFSYIYDSGNVIERNGDTTARYPIAHVLGGKNVYYLLTPLDRGRLQVLPIAYDLRRKEWFDTAASAMRHFQGTTDRPVHWRDPLYTFNTSCHACHVSQLATNYDPVTDTYRTIWAEAGINCETCHGPSGAHVEAMKQLAPGQKPENLNLISTSAFTAEQHNDSCSSCHAKASIITIAYPPGSRFFDHFDLVALENPDSYPDGRDLGENYTYTTWRMSPCANSGQLHCVQCHTSSGRYRFAAPEKANYACLPCHEDRVNNAPAHTRHKPDSTGNRCVACHMPMTEFARMRRSDHSMRPPTPATTIAHKSPNACNLCHTDQDAAWADQLVRTWHAKDYQAPVLHRAGLLAAARRGDWNRLPEMLACITEKNRDEMLAAGLIRLLVSCNDDRKWPAVLAAITDPSPLVRSAAASALTGNVSEQATAALVAATKDEYRLVRIRAAGVLAGHPQDSLDKQGRQRLAAAVAELEASLKARPDDWASQYNLGNLHADRGQFQTAVECFRLSATLRPDVVPPLVNVAPIYARLGKLDLAEQALQKALGLDPASAPANFNLGLLKAEKGDVPAAERLLRKALHSDPNLAPAAYNLALIVSNNRLDEAIGHARAAARAQPRNPQYAYTLALFLRRAARTPEAIDTLRNLLARHPDHLDAYQFLGSIHEESGEFAKAVALYRQALARPDLPPDARRFFLTRVVDLPQN